MQKQSITFHFLIGIIFHYQSSALGKCFLKSPCMVLSASSNHTVSNRMVSKPTTVNEITQLSTSP